LSDTKIIWDFHELKFCVTSDSKMFDASR
jgi:hypothetical protein